jgi:hypothetical protein
MSIPSSADNVSTSKCTKCGVTIPTNAKFCMECGTLLAAQTATASASTPTDATVSVTARPSRGSSIALFLLALLVWAATIAHDTLGFMAPASSEAIGADLFTCLVWAFFFYSGRRLYKAIQYRAQTDTSTSLGEQPQTGPPMRSVVPTVPLRTTGAISPVGISGWLLVLIIRLWVGTAVGLANASTATTEGIGSPIPTVVVTALCIGLAVLAASAALLLTKRSTKGVLVAKVFFVLDASVCGLGLFSALNGIEMLESRGFPLWFRPAGFLVANVLWFIYLVRSQRVKNTYPATPASTALADGNPLLSG